MQQELTRVRSTTDRQCGASAGWEAQRTSERDGTQLQSQPPPRRLHDVPERHGHDRVRDDREQAPLERRHRAPLRHEPVLQDHVHRQVHQRSASAAGGCGSDSSGELCEAALDMFYGCLLEGVV